MAWTSPVSGNAVPAQNERLLYTLAQSVAVGHGRSAGSAFTFNTDNQEYDAASRIVLDMATLLTEGTPQLRIVQTVQISAVGACTSFTPQFQVYVEAASASTGQVNTTKTLYAATTFTGGTLTTGFKSVDSGWVNCSSLNTNDLTGYGFLVLRPRFRLNSVTGNPTLFHLTAQVYARVA